jgi:hypothetical protein
MNQNYALHKRFIKDVDRIVGRDENLGKVISYAVNYLSLRQIHSDEISNQDLIEVARKISFVDFELPEIYKEMIKDLSNQEFIFRIKRIKYLKNTKNSIAIVSSPLLRKIGKELMSTTITSNIALMDDGTDHGEDSVSDEKIAEGEGSGDQVENQNFDTLEYLAEIWDDPDQRLKWLLKNMKYANRKHGYSQDHGYTPEEISSVTGKNVLTVKHYVRKYLRENSVS